MRKQQYRGRLMSTFNDVFPRRPKAERIELFEAGRRLQAAHFPVADDSELTRSQRLRAQLLRAGERRQLEALIRADPIIPLTARISSARFVNGDLDVQVASRWSDKAGRRLRLTRHGDRVTKALPRALRDLFTPEQLDLTDDIRQAAVQIGVRSQSSRICWMQPSTYRVEWTERRSNPDFSISAESRVAPSVAAMGKPLDRGIWQLTARGTLGTLVQHRLVYGEVVPEVHLDDRGSAAVYCRPDGLAVLDFDQTGQPLSALVRATGAVRREAGRTVIDVTGLPPVDHWSGRTKVEVDSDGTATRTGRWPMVTAELRVTGERQELVLDVDATAPVRLRVGQRRPDTASTFVLTPGLDELTPASDPLAPVRRAARPLTAGVERVRLRMRPSVDRAKRQARRILRRVRSR
jgi:hypothetical protein